MNDLIESIIAKFVKLGIPETTDDDSPQARREEMRCTTQTPGAEEVWVQEWPGCEKNVLTEQDAEDLYASHFERLWCGMEPVKSHGGFEFMHGDSGSPYCAYTCVPKKGICVYATTKLLAIDQALTEILNETRED